MNVPSRKERLAMQLAQKAGITAADTRFVNSGGCRSHWFGASTGLSKASA